ncbi:bifunctional folylpolyglutamate synthase/dihydrofolate synthase [Marinicella sp. S1101]|uniref:bifunctional folylpolyglutamate synthase/dihydrofolate synthase n=1 Tax=Marinicella marina TaxID=2996016 RepID=UPI002260DFFC|nr:folylpolyglutamate synthase/dihydrofolate synthase family protein [Marinicella marina]MCX7554446.1 bifunctional folylpolyglutamate synthase/dihydrofolate synthase [Marinicella marina]MDJ1140597.1 folylpolyglutamate synthase/dihydrofolate synthase family protein [Marinicella marina]
MKSLWPMTTPKGQNKTSAKSALAIKLDELNQYKIDLGLDRLQLVIEQLAIASELPQIITVGGTNGKGSTVAAICSLLKTQNKTYGAFTSPHLFKFNERIEVNDTLATDDEILKAFNTIDEAKGTINLSYFEYAFLAALLVFIEHRVEVMVLEVGLGGRLDATNVLDADACVITTVDLDHTQWLGDTIEAIAMEKAGIMRAEKPIIFGASNTPTAIIEQAESIGARLYQQGIDYQLAMTDVGFDYVQSDRRFTGLNKPQLLGDYQIQNFASALTVLITLGYEFNTKQLNHALSSWHINGRLQIMNNKPLVVADVAHNRQSAQQLAKYLHDHPVAGQTRAVFSVLADKNLASWLGELVGEFSHWLIFPLNNQRAMPIDELKITLADDVGVLSQFEDGETALQAAKSLSDVNDRIVVFGSFHVLEEVFSSDL